MIRNKGNITMRCLLSILILLGISVSVCSQETVKSLKRKQRQAKQNIEMTNRLLNENKKNQKTGSPVAVIKPPKNSSPAAAVPAPEMNV